MVRKELNNLIRPLKKEKKYQRPTHFVMFGNKEDEQYEYVFCFEEQIDMCVEFLVGKFEHINVTQIGATVINIMEADSMKKYQVVITNKVGNLNNIRFTGVPSKTYPTDKDVEAVVRVFHERFTNIQPDEHGCLYTVSIQEVWYEFTLLSQN